MTDAYYDPETGCVGSHWTPGCVIFKDGIVPKSFFPKLFEAIEASYGTECCVPVLEN